MSAMCEVFLLLDVQEVAVLPLRGQGQVRRALRSPFVKYYVQDETDEGYDIYTDITNSEV